MLAFTLLASCSSARGLDGTGTVRFTLSSTVPPSAEQYMCQLVRMPASDAEIFVNGGQDELSPGTHHFLVYRTSLSEIPLELSGTSDCSEHGGWMQVARGFVTGGQTRQENADFPEAAAIPFKPGEVLLMQAHFLNAGSRDLEAHATVLFRTTTAEHVAHRAGVLQFYNPFIFVGAHGESSATMRCPIKQDITLLSAGSHMHKHGVSYEAFIDGPSGPPETSPFFTAADWDHPSYWLGFRAIKAGSQVRFRCGYKNASDASVTQGRSAERDEMCMFGGFYYPAMDPKEEACTDMDMHGTGTSTCAATTACLEACPAASRPHFETGSAEVGECWQRCVTASCPNVTKVLFPHLSCTKTKCASECAASGDPCRACVSSKCGAEWGACKALACGPS